MIKKSKQERQEAIAEILGSYSIDSQDSLLTMLFEMGFELTQATLSRDFKEMRISRTPDAAGNYYYRLPETHFVRQNTEKYGVTTPFYKQGVIYIEFSGQMGVIKTPQGYAKGVAQDIENNLIPGVIATIAGSDVVLMLLRENAIKSEIIRSLKMLFSLK